MMKNLNDIAKFALDALLNAGADEAACVVSSGVTDELNIDSGEISLMRSLFGYKISLKALKDKKKGVIIINNLDDDSITEAAKQCLETAEASLEDDANCISERTENADFVTGILELDRDKFFERIKEYLADVKKDYPQIMIEQLVTSYDNSETLFANTNGVVYSSRHGSYSLNTMFSAHDGENSTSFNYCDVSFDNPDCKILDLGMQRDLYEKKRDAACERSF